MGNPLITTHADIRHNTCSVNESKCADHASAWSPPYVNAAPLKPRAMGRLNISSTSGQSLHRRRNKFQIQSPPRSLACRNLSIKREAIFQRVTSELVSSIGKRGHASKPNNFLSHSSSFDFSRKFVPCRISPGRKSVLVISLPSSSRVPCSDCVS